MIAGLLLILIGAGLVAALVVVVRSRAVQLFVFRGSAGLRSRARLSPVEPEVFARRLEAGIYVGMCLGGVIALLGFLIAIG